ncbi:MAG: CDP-glycerol glycerophosphotransferase family protein [Verrucomicrobiae bacterium]|nr:CDP-glycerol glycerophosphotransferase family protein [Verrucomicrobiae bacterium]NNJ42512.1 hypothetical protein [Akkermansiaceae bacterium]
MKLYFGIVKLAIASAIACVIPRSRDIWVVGGNKGLRFADNSMYFYLYCLKNTDKKMIWLTRSNSIVEEVRSKGGDAYINTSLMGLYYGFRAKWHVFDVSKGDTKIFSSKGANLFNLWHGYPLKDIRRLKAGNPDGVNLKGWKHLVKTKLLGQRERSDCNYVLWQNEQYVQHALDSFDVKPENIITANLPRNVVFEDGFDECYYLSDAAARASEKLVSHKKNKQKIVGYFPTWRGNGYDLFMGVADRESIERLNEFCESQNIVVVTKWHTCLYKDYQHPCESSSAEDITSILTRMSNIEVFGFELDLNSILPKCDLMISDYSGAIFDYLLINKPLIFMAYDLENYTKEWGILFDYESFVPGDIVKNLDDLQQCLVHYVADPENFSSRYEKQRLEAKAEIFERADGNSAIVEQMQKIV